MRKQRIRSLHRERCSPPPAEVYVRFAGDGPDQMRLATDRHVHLSVADLPRPLVAYADTWMTLATVDLGAWSAMLESYAVDDPELSDEGIEEIFLC